MSERAWDGIWRKRHVDVLDTNDCVVDSFIGDVEWLETKHSHYAVKYNGVKFAAKRIGSRMYTIKPSDKAIKE
ncbi:MAG: hypothetical protein ACRETA_04405 [Gammaproteobacteria bacterium]